MGNLATNLASCVQLDDQDDDSQITYLAVGGSTQNLSKPLVRTSTPTARSASDSELPSELSGSLIMRKPSLDYSTPPMTPHHNQQAGISTEYHPAVDQHILPAQQQNLGYADALFKLGQAYEKGQDGLPKDAALAFESFLRSAELGNARSQLRVGFYYDAGLGMQASNTSMAAHWYRKSAEQGEPKAMFSLGLALAKGNTDLGKRPEEAAAWFEKAAARGYDRAMYNYGYCLEMGLGVEKDFSRALELYNQARDLGNTHAKYRLAILEKQQ